MAKSIHGFILNTRTSACIKLSCELKFEVFLEGLQNFVKSSLYNWPLLHTVKVEILKNFAIFSEYLNFKTGHNNLWTQFGNSNHSAPAELLLCEHSLQAGFVGNSTFSCHLVPDIWSRRICFCFFKIKTNSEYIYDDSAWKIFASPGSC